MENVNPINEIPPDPEPRLESLAADEPNRTVATQQPAITKVAKRRTKTGCLTCRQRRIKCGEEKPICKNCTKSKRECKGYAQRLIFKNPLGIPGVPSTLPAQPLPRPSQHVGEINFQLTSAGTHGPMLAPRLPTNTASGSEQNPPPQPAGSYPPDLLLPAQTLRPGPASTYRPANPSVGLDQQRQEQLYYAQNDYSHYTVHGRENSQLRNETWTSQGSMGTVIPSQPSQAVYILEPALTQQDTTRHTHPSIEYQRTASHNQFLSPVSPSSPFAYIHEDDDFYDVGSDEELPEQVAMQDFNQLNMVMASANRDERQARLYTTMLDETNVLAFYQPTFGSSPLNNPKTARIFLHFIHATGPSLSIFERHGTDQSTMLGVPVPMAKQGLWTYTLPLKAFQHQALQQAVLALGSLHIAYLQQAPSTASLKHYQYALRRVGKAVGLPNQRKQLGTLAATLLLAYYEVMTADHFNWNNHLAGSAQLIREIDFSGITRDLRAQRRTRWRERSNSHSLFEDIYMFSNSAFSDDPFAELESTVDQNIIGCLLGRAVNYDQFGQVEVEHTRPRNRHLTRKDIETFRIQCDLYWWFCKQDWLQSLLSAGPLFLPFSQWAQCPPRAGLGLRNDVYGTADHMTLLMGRLADFAVRDRKRKLKAAKATGSNWRPDARFGQFMAKFAPRPVNPGNAPPNASFGPPRGPAGAPSQRGSQESHGGNAHTKQQSSGLSGSSPKAPTMYGMVPSSGPKHLPAAFATTSDRDDPHHHNDGGDAMSYEEAESEWESILAAFEVFTQSLGTDFLPLSPDTTMPVYSPFGLAIQYHTLNMASLMGFYYTGRILLLRLHPAMPPPMHVAAGYAASVTADFAQIIGKIAAGIYGAQTSQSGVEGFSPTIGSCLIEITVPLFFAGVQYMAPDQRDWIINVLRDISRLTGWKSADAIARGCERAWIAAAEQGRGPPYERREGNGTQQPPGWRYADANANIERRFVTVSKPPPVWAMGILSLDDHDYEKSG
ncbi:hypothetical protein BDW62DRAFT_218425 [Aspergillus aurantiobrunneus]